MDSKFSGRFSCPGYKGPGQYKGETNQWEAAEMIFEHQVVNGVDIIVRDSLGENTHKNGPYNKHVYIVDGMWRYYPLYRNETLYPVKGKFEFEGDKLNWYAEYPEIIDNEGKKRKPRKSEGSLWFDSNGDQIVIASYFKGQIKCKRLTDTKK